MTKKTDPQITTVRLIMDLGEKSMSIIPQTVNVNEQGNYYFESETDGEGARSWHKDTKFSVVPAPIYDPSTPNIMTWETWVEYESEIQQASAKLIASVNETYAQMRHRLLCVGDTLNRYKT